MSRIIGALSLNRSDEVIEIGPGQGALTYPLLEELDQLTVIEIDRDLIARLRQKNLPSLRIYEGDVLTLDLAQMSSNDSLRVVGNLPYNISTPLLLRLIDYHASLRDIHVMLQKEVIERLSAVVGTRHYGRLTVLIQSVFDVSPLFHVPPAAFEPAPRVDSGVVRLTPRAAVPDDATLHQLQQATRIAFASRRKTLRNNFKGYLTAEALEELGIDPGTRAETIDVSAFLALAKRLSLL